jgi:citrate synthase
VKVETPPICVMDGDQIIVRGQNLASDLMGNVSFTEMMLLDVDGALPGPGRVKVVDAILVAMMEHGVTPSTLAARLVIDGAPEAMQGALAAGLLAAGSRFLGTIEQAGEAVAQVVDNTDDDVNAAAREFVRGVVAAGGRVPGVGHNLHNAVDPRVARLLEIGRDNDALGAHVTALEAIERAVLEETGRQLVPNVAGVIGALLLDLGYAPHQVRGFAAVARCAGVFAHVLDEQEEPMARELWTVLNKEQEA